jgi:TPR repeat protein
MRHVLRVALVAIVLGCSVPVVAGPFDDAYAAFQRQDYATAARLWRPLAERGHDSSQFFLGYMSYLGYGVPQDYAKAMMWFRRAAAQGNAEAEYNIGVLYDRGEGITQDYSQALVWYRKSVTQGYALAAYNLGVMYLYGRGVAQDYIEAHKWLNIAAATNAAWGQKERDMAAEARDRVAAKMTPAQIAEAQRRAAQWKPSREWKPSI